MRNVRFILIAAIFIITSGVRGYVASASVVGTIGVIKITIVHAPMRPESVSQTHRSVYIDSAFPRQQISAFKIGQRTRGIYDYRLLDTGGHDASRCIVWGSQWNIERVSGKSPSSPAAQSIGWGLPAIFEFKPRGRFVGGANIVYSSAADKYIRPQLTLFGIYSDVQSSFGSYSIPTSEYGGSKQQIESSVSKWVFIAGAIVGGIGLWLGMFLGRTHHRGQHNPCTIVAICGIAARPPA